MTAEARFVVGIDLGTSNSAVAYAKLDETRNAGRPIIRELEVLQLATPGDIQSRKLLPSALYQAANFEISQEQCELPWGTEDNRSDDKHQTLVGQIAKRLGGKTPVRLIESAKSWLCHGEVQRNAPILPWHAPDEIPKLSPVEASACYLRHLRQAWNHQVADGQEANFLENQRVTVTVPASFDELARRLTLEAAKKAGLPEVTLIEEPLAAFYAFVARTGGTPRTTGLAGGERVLVADVGGGTTDFTLIQVQAPKNNEDGSGILQFERTAVGDHLLLGGDNMDLALAHALEPSLNQAKKLDSEGWAQLKLECRLAKETLFSHLDKAQLPITIAGRGSKLIGNTMRTELTQKRLHEVILEGYFPALPPGPKAKPKRSAQNVGFTEYGLPYTNEPAVTRHLAAFLMRHAPPGEPVATVDAILFNGGALKPPVIRDRVSEVLGDWLRQTTGKTFDNPKPLIYDEGVDVLEVAVARGAAYFGLVREGLGIRVGGGSPREYFLGIDADQGDAQPKNGQVQVLCIAPRGMQDGQSIDIRDRTFSLVTNRPVEFPLFSTTSPRQDPVGSVLSIDPEELEHLPPLQTVVKFGKQKAGTTVPVRVQVRRTELGNLELSLLSKMSGARFKLEFDIRAKDQTASKEKNPDTTESPAGSLASEAPFGGAGTRAPPEMGDVEPERLDAAKQVITDTFQPKAPRPDPDNLMKALEADLGLGRDAFPLSALRTLAEHLLELADRRALGPALEARWMNLTGFCLRPGFGVPLDDWRVRQLWKIHGSGLCHPSHDPSELNWWILWRRVSGGLSRGHQEELSSTVFPLILPALAKRARRRIPKPQSQQAAEMWRAAASLERIGAKSRAQMGEALLTLLEANKAPRGALWCLGRIGARKLLYGPREATVKASIVAGWTERLLQLKKLPKGEALTPCLISLARLTGDRQFDLPENTRNTLEQALSAKKTPQEVLRPLLTVVQMDQSSERTAFGEGLPTGLRLA